MKILTNVAEKLVKENLSKENIAKLSLNLCN